MATKKIRVYELARELGVENHVVLELADAPHRYHAILDTVRKRYRYVIDDGERPDIFLRNYAWHYREPLDAEAMCAMVEGLAQTQPTPADRGSGTAVAQSCTLSR